MPLGLVARRMAASSFPHFIVVDEAGDLTGVLTLRDLRSLLGTDQPFPAATPASELMQRKVFPQGNRQPGNRL